MQTYTDARTSGHIHARTHARAIIRPLIHICKVHIRNQRSVEVEIDWGDW